MMMFLMVVVVVVMMMVVMLMKLLKKHAGFGHPRVLLAVQLNHRVSGCGGGQCREKGARKREKEERRGKRARKK